MNESVLTLKTAEIAQVSESKTTKQAKGGYQNPALINWETDNEVSFAITHGVLSPSSWCLLTNSKMEKIEKKSVSFNETLKTMEDADFCCVDLKHIPNCCKGIMGLQPNPHNEPLPMGRRQELMLKPLPPSKEKFLFIYDVETGKRIENYELYQNRIYFKSSYREVYVDYTFDYEDKAKVIRVGDRLLNGFLSLSGKMSVKDENSGLISTALLEIPKIKLSSSLSLKLGKGYDYSTVSDFFFTGYPDENVRREKQLTCKITFLEQELTEDYI